MRERTLYLRHLMNSEFGPIIRRSLVLVRVFLLQPFESPKDQGAANSEAEQGGNDNGFSGFASVLNAPDDFSSCHEDDNAEAHQQTTFPEGKTKRKKGDRHRQDQQDFLVIPCAIKPILFELQEFHHLRADFGRPVEPEHTGKQQEYRGGNSRPAAFVGKKAKGNQKQRPNVPAPGIVVPLECPFKKGCIRHRNHHEDDGQRQEDQCRDFILIQLFHHQCLSGYSCNFPSPGLNAKFAKVRKVRKGK